MATGKRWVYLGLRWIQMLLGRSYYHLPQGLGRVFEPGRLRGYFNDLTGKTLWPGPTDDKGIPVNLTEDGRRVYFATTIAQKALGHWDRWVMAHNPRKGHGSSRCATGFWKARMAWGVGPILDSTPPLPRGSFGCEGLP